MSCVFQQDEGGFASTNNNNEETNELYFMGIIDILQPYDLRKRLEHSIKSVRYDRVLYITLFFLKANFYFTQIYSII